MHVKSRDRRLLIQLAGGLAGGGLLLAMLITGISTPRYPASMMSEEMRQLQSAREEHRRLELATESDPRRMAAWLREIVTVPLVHEGRPADRLATFLGKGEVGPWSIGSLIDRHAANDATKSLMRDFVLAALAQSEPEGEKAVLRLKTLAAEEPPPMLANEFAATLYLMARNREGALAAFLREGLAFPEASEARETAVRLAVTLRDADSLRRMAEVPGWVEASPPAVLHHAGVLVNNLRWQWEGLVHHRLAHFPVGWVALTLLTVGLWYAVLVMHTEPLPWRWTRPIFPVMAGVASIWPTLALLAYQEVELGFTQDVPFPHDLWYFIAGVGLREELAKLALFSIFLPWLLYRGDGGKALMTGAFTGLGFALEENLGYFQDFGSGAAWARFLSANFLHIALTGLAGHALYRMLRTRFGAAEHFIGTFLAVVVAHGAYDWAAVSEIEGMDWASIIVLAVVANYFFSAVAEESPARRTTVSPPAVFLVGAGMLVGTLFVLSAIETGQTTAVAATGKECLGLAPLIFIYWRKFEHHLLR